MKTFLHRSLLELSGAFAANYTAGDIASRTTSSTNRMHDSEANRSPRSFIDLTQLLMEIPKAVQNNNLQESGIRD